MKFNNLFRLFKSTNIDEIIDIINEDVTSELDKNQDEPDINQDKANDGKEVVPDSMKKSLDAMNVDKKNKELINKIMVSFIRYLASDFTGNYIEPLQANQDHGKLISDYIKKVYFKNAKDKNELLVLGTKQDEIIDGAIKAWPQYVNRVEKNFIKKSEKNKQKKETKKEELNLKQPEVSEKDIKPEDPKEE